MNFERSEQLKPILDDLERDDQTFFRNLQQKVLAKSAASGRLWDSSTTVLLFEAFRDELTERAKRVFSEIVRVLDGAYVSDLDVLVEALKSEWSQRMTRVASVASCQNARRQN